MPVGLPMDPVARDESLIPEAGTAGVLGQMTTRAGTGLVCVSGCPLAWRARRAAWPGLLTVATSADLAARARRRSLVSVIAATRHAISTQAATARSTTSDRSRCP